MHIVEIQERRIEGLCVRTCNADESDPNHARIGDVWAKFEVQVAPHIAPGAMAYGVYHHYASDVNGAYDLLVGSDAVQQNKFTDAHALQAVNIQAGPYVVFQSCGATPQAVIETWERVWTYFSDPHCRHQRAYTSDFERYGPDGLLDIHIALVAK
jgi:predicted transcriptional regulator YdeE